MRANTTDALRTAKGITGGFSRPSPRPLPVGERVQRTVIPFAVLIAFRGTLRAEAGPWRPLRDPDDGCSAPRIDQLAEPKYAHFADETTLAAMPLPK